MIGKIMATKNVKNGFVVASLNIIFVLVNATKNI